MIWFFILFGGLLGSIHRPTFYIFGLTYFFYAFINPYTNKRYDFEKLKNNIFYGILILIIAGAFYLGRFKEAILIILPEVAEGFIQPGHSPGTFINFFTYQFSTLAYLPFALLGFFALCKKKQFNMIFLWTAICGIIVYFQFFFFNRFIIHLDIGLIILSAIGFGILIENKKKLGIGILILMLFSAGFVTFNKSMNTEPGITEEQLYLIQQLKNTEENSSIMAISSEYSPFVLGYSGRKTIAPGLFDENKWTKEEWQEFWHLGNGTDRKERTKELMEIYQKPIYLFVGDKVFDNPCFENYMVREGNRVLRYEC